MEETAYAEHAKVFKALCDENRLKILSLLRSRRLCACDLLDQVEVSQSGLSYHMKILVDSGIVESQQRGKWTYYNISEEGSLQAIELVSLLTTVEEPYADTDFLDCEQLEPGLDESKIKERVG